MTLNLILPLLTKLIKPLTTAVGGLIIYFQGKKAARAEINEDILKEKEKDYEIEQDIDAMSNVAVLDKLRDKYSKDK